jgi:uncharacterized protein (TIGR00255 family)
MTLSSMTGFGVASGTTLFFNWAWELKSVNGKALDVRVRLPNGWEAHETEIKTSIAKCITRGNIAVNLTLSGQVPQTIAINQAILTAYLEAATTLAAQHGLAMPTTADLLQLRGVADVSADLSEDDLAHVRDAALAGLRNAIDALVTNRDAEGARLADILGITVDRIDAASKAARAEAATQSGAIAARLNQRLEELLGGNRTVDPERLAQEVAVLAAKADVTEELDRLDGHISAARELLAKQEPVGRAFDFLAQEFNRETNTLCAKSSSTALTRIGLDLKALIDQLREQIQNVE